MTKRKTETKRWAPDLYKVGENLPTLVLAAGLGFTFYLNTHNYLWKWGNYSNDINGSESTPMAGALLFLFSNNLFHFPSIQYIKRKLHGINNGDGSSSYWCYCWLLLLLLLFGLFQRFWKQLFLEFLWKPFLFSDNSSLIPFMHIYCLFEWHIRHLVMFCSIVVRSIVVFKWSSR